MKRSLAGLAGRAGLQAHQRERGYPQSPAFRAIAKSFDLATVLDGIERMLAAGLKVKVNMVPMRGVNVDQILPMLDYCLARGIELRYIELMNMGHLTHSAIYQRQFFGMDDILALVASRYEFARTDAAFDATAVRYEIPGQGILGIIATESEPSASLHPPAPFLQSVMARRLVLERQPYIQVAVRAGSAGRRRPGAAAAAIDGRLGGQADAAVQGRGDGDHQRLGGTSSEQPCLAPSSSCWRLPRTASYRRWIAGSPPPPPA